MKTGKSGEFQLRRNAYSRPRSICGAAASSTSVKKKKRIQKLKEGGGCFSFLNQRIRRRFMSTHEQECESAATSLKTPRATDLCVCTQRERERHIVGAVWIKSPSERRRSIGGCRVFFPSLLSRSRPHGVRG